MIKTKFVILVALMFLSACAPRLARPDGALQAAGLAGFYCVSHDSAGNCTIYRSAQPTPAQFVALVKVYGIKSVIKLNDVVPDLDGGDDTIPSGVTIREHHWLPAGPVTNEQMTDMLGDIQELPKPLLIHCTHGEDRTGLAVAVYRVKVEHMLPLAAWNEWIAFGRDIGLFLLSESFEHATGWANK